MQNIDEAANDWRSQSLLRAFQCPAVVTVQCVKALGVWVDWVCEGFSIDYY